MVLETAVTHILDGEGHEQRDSGSRQTRNITGSQDHQATIATRLTLESREAMHRRAMHLLSTRCDSVKQDADGDNRFTFGVHVPKYFYVTQQKPIPMEPLKAWRGYHGNIYFEPININHIKIDTDSERAKVSVTKETKTTRSNTTAISRLGTFKDKGNWSSQEGQSESRQTKQNSHAASHLWPAGQMAHMNKLTVLNKLNDNIHEDLVWLDGRDNTGSLDVRSKFHQDQTLKKYERDLQYNKVRIRKGSVVHKLCAENVWKQYPKLAVNGGKFIAPNSSPFLRIQTQYSLSSNRRTNNTPVPFHLRESRLHPLDQIRVSLKRMDSWRDATEHAEKTPYNQPFTYTEEWKPIVKYTSDVVAK